MAYIILLGLLAILILIVVLPSVNLPFIEKWEAKRKQRRLADLQIEYADDLSGHDFEFWCAKVLDEYGFSDVVVTKGSGDMGVDILAWLDGEKYAIQCKRFSKNLGNKPVQEIVAGRVYYGCDIGAVMTNQYFTTGATLLAEKNDVQLWDRDAIKEMIIEAKNNV